MYLAELSNDHGVRQRVKNEVGGQDVYTLINENLRAGKGADEALSGLTKEVATTAVSRAFPTSWLGRWLPMSGAKRTVAENVAKQLYKSEIVSPIIDRISRNKALPADEVFAEYIYTLVQDSQANE